MFGNHAPEASAAYDSDGTTSFARMLTLVKTDKVWAEPARFTARALTSKSIPVYLYLFSYVPVSMKEWMQNGAAHGSEIAYVFDNLVERNGIIFTEQDKKVGKLMNAYWVNFAKTGNPNGKELPLWPVYDSTKNEVFEFTQDGAAGNFFDPRKARLDVIEKAFESTN